MKPETPRWRRYLRLWGTDVTGDVEEEFRFHVEERVDELVAAGRSAAEARQEALRGFGDLERVKTMCEGLARERERAMRRSEWWGALSQDVVFALRQMVANRSLTLAIVLTLGLGIGATTAIFSVVHTVLLRPLPYADPDRIVVLWETFREFTQGRASPGHFYDWTEQSTVLEATAAHQARTYTLTGDADPERILAARVTPGFFRVQSMPPAAGRYFLPEEGRPGARVAVLSYELWQRRFGGDAAVVGREVELSGEAHLVVGVAPRAFTLTDFDERLWTPLSFEPEQRANYGNHAFLVLAKLKPGVTLERAQSDLDRVTAGIGERHPDEMQNRGINVQPLLGTLVAGYRTQLWVLLGAVAFVLLIACGNVVSLLLARAMIRRREIAIRGALGGGRGRLLRQLMTESLVLALAGGAVGILVAHFGVRFLVGMGPAGLARLNEAGLNGFVLAFALATTLACGILFGLAPSLRATRSDLQSVLREGGRTSSGGSARDRVRAALVVAEVAVALVLLISAGLLIRSALRLQRVPVGFDGENVTMMRIALPPDRYESAEAVAATFGRIVERVRALPGVERAAATTRPPMWGMSIDIGLRVDGKPFDPENFPYGHLRMVTADHLEVLRIPMVAGRTLTDADMAAGAPWVAVINETLARRAFGAEDAIGHRLSGWTSGPEPEWREVVGVVADTRSFGRETQTEPEIFVPYTQAPVNAWPAMQRQMAVLARTAAGHAVASGMRDAVRSVDPSLAVADVQTLADVLSLSNATRRFNTLLLGLLGLTGLILAAIGIYGVIAFFVTQRTHEIGVRMALGATARDVVRLVVKQGMTLTAAGLVIGFIAAAAATRVLSSLLFEVNAVDALTYAIGALLLGLVGIGAALLPARRAARVEPVRSLTSS